MAKQASFHEDFGREAPAKAGSERAFGFVFAAVFAIIGLWPLLAGAAPRLWALGVAAVFLLAALLFPKALGPLNRLWFKFGLLLHRIVSPLVMGFLFFVTVTPVALIVRLCGKDVLNLRFQREAKSYWIERTPPGPAPDTMRRQF